MRVPVFTFVLLFHLVCRADKISTSDSEHSGDSESSTPKRKTQTKSHGDDVLLVQALVLYREAVGCVRGLPYKRSDALRKKLEDHLNSIDWSNVDFLRVVEKVYRNEPDAPNCIPPLLDYVKPSAAMVYFSKLYGPKDVPGEVQTKMLDNIVFSLVHDGTQTEESRTLFRDLLRPKYMDFGVSDETVAKGKLLPLAAWLGDPQVIEVAKRAIDNLDKKKVDGDEERENAFDQVMQALFRFQPADIPGSAEAAKEIPLLLSRINAHPNAPGLAKMRIQDARKKAAP